MRLLSSRGFTTKILLMGAGGLLLVLLLVGAGVLVLRGQLKTTPSGPVNLTYWGLWESPAIMQPLIDSYQKTHPNVKIKYEQRPIDNHYATVKSRLAGKGGEVPDMVRVHSSWVPVLKNGLSSLPKSVMNNAVYESTFYPVTKESLLFDGQYYALPLEIDGLALIYNQDLFNKAGINAPPVTWDDVRQDAAKLTARDGGGKLAVGGIAMGSARNVDHFADIVGLLMAQNGVAFTDSKGNVNFHKSLSPDGRNLGAEALAFYTLFSTSEKYWDDTMPSSTLAFSQGKVAMILAPSWDVLSILSQNPQMQFKVAPVPHLTTQQKTGYASYWVEAVPKNSTHQQAAWEFLKYLTDRDQQVSLSAQQQQSRPFGEPSSRVDLASSLGSDPLAGPYVSQAPEYRTSFFTTDARATELNDAIRDRLAAAVGRTAASGGSGERDSVATAALNDLAKDITTILTNQR